MLTAKRSKTVRFGAFVADFGLQVLTKSGVRMKVPAQALRILEALVERPGELVSRQELCRLLWPDDTHVQFEHSLNVMVNRLREVLGDSARQPRFIETAPKQGYRFVAAVEWETAPPEEIPSSPAIRVGRWAWWAAGVGAAAVVWLGVWLWMGRRVEDRPTYVVPLTTFAGSKDMATFSPDGSQVAFVWDGNRNPNDLARSRQRDLYVKVVDQGEPVRLTDTPGNEEYPGWSPDGRRIAFQRRDEGKSWIYFISALGGLEQRVCEAGPGFSWSPDGRRLALAGGADEKGRNQIFLHDLATGTRRQVTVSGSYSDSFPRFSPDGESIAFQRSFTVSAREVMVVRVGGGEARRLTFDQRPVAGHAWTGDGKEIVFSANRGDGEQLWRVPIRGGTPERVSTSSVTALAPAVSRDGRRLAFTEQFTDANLYSYSGAAPPKLTLESSRDDHSPSFSPDGSRVVFASKRSGTEEIWIADAGEAGPAVRLTSFRGPAAGSPRWSPDGQWIAFDARVSGSPDVYVMRPDGGGMRKVTESDAAEFLPSWSRDSQWIYFATNRTGTRTIWKQRLAGGEAVQVTRGEGFESFESPDGKWLYFTRNQGRDGIWGVNPGGGEERLVKGLEDAGFWRAWAVTRRGVYFVPRSAVEVRLLDLATGQVKLVRELRRAPVSGYPGLAVTQDGTRMIVAHLDQAVNDLMLIEGFR
ncbi:MAG: winged helix-turn-helix domain-containing protein [Bryobacteraceae bacterium]|nr:winged helix-turn-helix domain-containing protein [Bryobacteraceae bacterium]